MQERQDQAGMAGIGNGHLFLKSHHKWVPCGIFPLPAKRVAESNYMRKLIRPLSRTGGVCGHF